MSWQSRVPAVLDALVALWSATPGLAGLVQDGPEAVVGANLELLTVGYDGGEDGAAVDGLITPEGFGVRPDREQVTVTCVIEVVNGAGDTRAARTRAYELLGHASGALTADRKLGGLVMEAHVQGVSLNQQQTDTGALVRLLFTVDCDTYTVR